MPDKTDTSKPKRGRVVKARKKDSLTPAEFVPVDSEETTPSVAPADAPEEIAKPKEKPETAPENVIAFPGALSAEEMSMLQKADAKELDDARQKLKIGATLTAKEKKLLTKAAQAAKANDLPPNPDFDPGKIAESLNAYWVNGDGTSFQLRDQSPGWLKVPEEKFKTALLRRGIEPYALGGEPISRIDQVIMHVMERRTLDFAIEAIAGYKDGVHPIKGSKVLVRRGPELLTPQKGTFPTIITFLEGLLGMDVEDPKKQDPALQVKLFIWWMARVVENLYASPGVRLNSQILILAGPHGCGKSRLQHMIITPLLGGRNADPSRYLFGETSFNSEWMRAEHLLIEDPRPSMKMQDRVQLAQHLKALCVNDDQSIHAKGDNAFGASPEFAVSISINDDPDALRILPPLTPDFEDKVLLFQITKRPLPMPTRTPDERRAFRDAINSELPAFLWFLLHEAPLDIPERWKNDRFGILAWHEPHLKMLLWEDSPSSELLAIIDGAEIETGERLGGVVNYKSLFSTAHAYTPEEIEALHPMGAKPTPAKTLLAIAAQEQRLVWFGSFQELQERLDGSRHAKVANKLIQHNALPRLLSRLAQDKPDRVAQYRTSKGRFWMISSPEPVAAEVEPEPVIA